MAHLLRNTHNLIKPQEILQDIHYELYTLGLSTPT